MTLPLPPKDVQMSRKEVFVEPVTRGTRARPGGLPEAGYLNGVAHGGSSSSTASAVQGSRLSKSGSAPGLVEAAAVKLENQRLREEIRSMCNTIKSQSKQLSELWAETKKLQARKPKRRTGVSELISGVAELSRRQLAPPALSRARSAGSLLSGVESDGWAGAHGQPMQPSAVSQGAAHLQPSTLKAHAYDQEASAAPPTLAFELYKAHTDRLDPHRRQPLFTPTITPLPDSCQSMLGRMEQRTVGAASAPNLRVLADPLEPSLRQAGVVDDLREAASGFRGILEPSTVPPAPGAAVSLMVLAQNINLARLVAKKDLVETMRGTMQEDIARELGKQFLPEHVEVRLSADSLALPVTVKPPQGMASQELHRLMSGKSFNWSSQSRLKFLESFGVCLSSDWCFTSVGLPSIVDESSPKPLSQELPAVGDEPHLALPQSLERSGHTPREGRPPKAKAKASRAKAKVKRPPDTGPQVRRLNGARQLNFSGLSDTPYYQPMLLGDGFGEDKEQISGLFVAGVDERPASPPSMTPQPPSPDVVTQPQPRPVELRRDVEVPRQLSRHASSDEEVNFIEDDTPAKPRLSRRVEQPMARRLFGSAGRRPEPKAQAPLPAAHVAPAHVAPAHVAPAPTTTAKADAEVEPPARRRSRTSSTGSVQVPATSAPAAPVHVAPAPAAPVHVAPAPAAPVAHAPVAAAPAPAEPVTPVPHAAPAPKAEVFQADSEESESDSEVSSEDESDVPVQVGERRKSNSAEVKDLIGDDSESKSSEEIEITELPQANGRTRAESLLSKE